MLDSITIESMTSCNAKCVICPHQFGRENHNMPLDEFEAILRFFPSLKGVVLCGLYEPLMDVRLNRILNIIDQVQPNADVTIFTNGSLLSGSKAEMLLSHANLKNLIVSIHGFSEQVYESVMVGLKRDKVYRNVLNFVRLRGSNTVPHVSISFVRIKQNIHELEDFRRFWKDKVDLVSDFEVCSWQGEVPVENLYYEYPRHTRACPMFDWPLVIDAFGNIVLCCYNFRTNYGHVLKGGYEEWLKKKRVSETYPLEECRKCNGWTYS